MELAYPMAEGPGAGADMTRWRRMGLLWSDDGVVRDVGSALAFWGWVDGAPGTVALGDGALFLNGFYARNENGKWLLTPGDDGTIVATLDTSIDAQRLTLDWVPDLHGWGGGGSLVTPWWQIPLWELNGHNQPVTDRRNMIPPIPPPPPVTDIPTWVPRGYFGTVNGPGTAVGLPVGNTTLVSWDPAGDGRWVPGRLQRYLAHVPYLRAVSQTQVYFYLSAGSHTERISWVDNGGQDCWAGTASFVTRGEPGALVSVWATCNFGPGLTVPAGSIRLDLEDAGA
jgi:hypothetical protein